MVINNAQGRCSYDSTRPETNRHKVNNKNIYITLKTNENFCLVVMYITTMLNCVIYYKL